MSLKMPRVLKISLLSRKFGTVTLPHKSNFHSTNDFWNATLLCPPNKKKVASYKKRHCWQFIFPSSVFLNCLKRWFLKKRQPRGLLLLRVNVITSLLGRWWEAFLSSVGHKGGATQLTPKRVQACAWEAVGRQIRISPCLLDCPLPSLSCLFFFNQYNQVFLKLLISLPSSLTLSREETSCFYSQEVRGNYGSLPLHFS